MPVSPKEVLTKLKEHLKDKNGRQAAKELGVSYTYIYDVLHGRRPVGPKLLKALGFKRTIVFEDGKP